MATATNRLWSGPEHYAWFREPNGGRDGRRLSHSRRVAGEEREHDHIAGPDGIGIVAYGAF